MEPFPPVLAKIHQQIALLSILCQKLRRIRIPLICLKGTRILSKEKKLGEQSSMVFPKTVTPVRKKPIILQINAPAEGIAAIQPAKTSNPLSGRKILSPIRPKSGGKRVRKRNTPI